MKDAKELASKHRTALDAAGPFPSAKLFKVQDEIRVEFLKERDARPHSERDSFMAAYYEARDPVEEPRPAPVEPSFIPLQPLSVWDTQGAKIEFLAGALGTGKGFVVGHDMFASPLGKLAFKHVNAVEIASEKEVKRLGSTVGWGAVGAVGLGPVGLLAGLLLGGKAKEVTFIIRLKDGRAALARANSTVYETFLARTL